ncbi:MAG: DUF4197 domain-containing protein, partial [Gemmatimonadaceae bacterium]|nr:DUF4197 domain-containing protein [Chitinophagaceae bacterium]
GTGGAVTEFEASQGIKQALSKGVDIGIQYLNKQDGFFGDQAYKLFLPEDAQKVETTLRTIGLGKQVDQAILQINRAAENAVGYAKPIFVDAITDMSVADALGIIRGGNTSATNYFRQKTSTALVAAFSPQIKSSLEKLNATKYYSDMVATYNSLPTTLRKVNPNLVEYVADKATIALFDQIAKEEANIRANPVARTTEILKKVFGSRYN